MKWKVSLRIFACSAFTELKPVNGQDSQAEHSVWAGQQFGDIIGDQQPWKGGCDTGGNGALCVHEGSFSCVGAISVMSAIMFYEEDSISHSQENYFHLSKS